MSLLLPDVLSLCKQDCDSLGPGMAINCEHLIGRDDSILKKVAKNTKNTKSGGLKKVCYARINYMEFH